MQHCRLSPTKRTAIGALLLVLAVAGCGSPAESSSGVTWSDPDAAASTIASRDAEPPADPSRTAEAARRPEAAPSPKATKKTGAPSGSGKHHPRCADGDCKVSFSGSVTFSLAKWTVSASMEKGGVQVRFTKANGMGGGGGFLAGPGCSVEMNADGGGRVGCDKPAAEPEPGGYAAHLLKLDGDTAVIRAILG